MKTTIDETRNLCETCKKKLTCTYDLQEYGATQNVIRCKKFSKVNENKLNPRVEVGDIFYHYTFKDENNRKLGFKTKSRIESKNRIDNLLYEVGNYFLSENECNKAIEIL